MPYSIRPSTTANDKPVVRSLLDALNYYDVLIAHNGLKFDLPFIRTRLAKWNLKPLPEKKLIDPVQIARNKLRMSGNSPASLTPTARRPCAATPGSRRPSTAPERA